MTDPRAEFAPSPETQSVRTPQHVGDDLKEAGLNITDLADEMNDDGSNARYVYRRVIAEIEWIFDLLDELADQAPQ